MRNNEYSPVEIKLFNKLNSPSKVQDYLNSLKFNFEKQGETCYSPRLVIKNQTAHCMEGAMFAASVLEFHKNKAWLLDLRATSGDFDHVVCVYKKFGFYGAVSKTNHAVLRFREPIYKTVRELALSYFHEYFLSNGKKTLREYSELFDLNLLKASDWKTSDKSLFEIPRALDKVKHFKILNREQIKNLRRADNIEIKVGEITEFKRDKGHS